MEEEVFVAMPRGMRYIFVNMDGGTGWYELEDGEKRYIRRDVCLRGVLSEIVLFEQTYNNKKYQPQLKIGLNFETSKGLYQVRVGARTVFAMTLVDSLRGATVEQLSEPILLGISPSEQEGSETVIFAKVFQSNGAPFMRPSDQKALRLEVWEHDYLTEIQNLAGRLKRGLRIDADMLRQVETEFVEENDVINF